MLSEDTSSPPPASDPDPTLPLPPASMLNGASLFLDFDGTLVELADRPDLVTAHVALPRLMQRLRQRLEGRLAVISGRGADEVARLLGNPAITIAGSHGAEIRLADGTITIPERPSSLSSVAEAFEAFASGWPGVLVENKPLGAALHYREGPAAEAACRVLAADLADTFGLHLQTGKMVVELRCAGADKGTALRRLMGDPPLRDTTPIFVGDDDTDEPAFVAARALGGAGILVGDARTTSATFRLPNVTSVLAWLDQAVA